MAELQNKSMKKPTMQRGVELESVSSILAGLNELGRGDEQKRLVEILKDIQKLDSMCAEVRRHSQEKEIVRIGDKEVPFPRLNDEALEAIKALNRFGSPILDRLNKQLLRSRWSFRMIAHNHRELLRVYNFHTKSDSGYAAERAISHFLEHYLPSGKIGRFRTCLECRKWFFAVVDHQKYCSEKCRLRHVAHSDEFREKRARYMRERYRPLIEELEQQAKRKAVKPKGR
jgi:hypothetical protein